MPNFSNSQVTMTSARDKIARYAVDRVLTSFGVGPILRGRLEGTVLQLAPHVTEEKLPICIIGAGAAGLYAALILKSLGVKFEILEAEESEERIGGRLFTHRFNGKAGRDAPINTPARYDYADMGAMRFPNINFHARVFKLFDYVNMSDLLIEYKMTADNTIMNYNSVGISKSDIIISEKYDVFQVSQEKGGFVPDLYLQSVGGKGYPNDGSYWVDKALQPYVEKFQTSSIPEAWANVIRHDSLSTRSFMMRQDPIPVVQSDKSTQTYIANTNNPLNYPDAVIEWLESLSTATGLYNQAFVESVMDAVDFDDPSVKTCFGYASSGKMFKRDLLGEVRTPDNKCFPWYCVDGGSDHIAIAMLEKLGSANMPKLGKSVTKIAPSPNGVTMQVSFRDKSYNGEIITKTYSQVICTVPLGCLASIDTSECSLSYTQKTAIRSLNYDSSTKVALKFQTRWWEDNIIMNCKPIVGGVSSTDLPIRTVVYPSYGLKTENPPGVMLASYTWSQDARRMGAISNSLDSSIKDICLQNLSTLHSVPLDFLEFQYVSHYTTDWYSDPLSRGAFALFGPGHLGKTDENGFSLFVSLKCPAANGRLHFAGEATSIHHAWVLGALNSAWRAVYNVLAGEQELREELKRLWGIPDEENEENLLKCYELSASKDRKI